MQLRTTTARCTFYAIVAALSIVGTAAHAQDTLTADQLRAMVDERIAAQNPFEELLNDPDSERSIAAMEIMLESGNPTLTRMALEFGLLSTNPTVRRIAVEAYMRSKPVLTLAFDGSSLEDTRYFQSRMSGNGAMMTPDKIGYWRMKVGDYDPAQGCFLMENGSSCFVTVNSDGVIVQSTTYMTGRLTIGDTGELSGSASLYQVDPLPLTIKLLD